VQKGGARLAYAAGFADQSHMTRHFKSRFGLTPGRYVALIRDGGRYFPMPAAARQAGPRAATRFE
jgi:AraC-like DNA-binding protein